MRYVRESAGKGNGAKKAAALLLFLIMVFCCGSALAAKQTVNVNPYYQYEIDTETKTATLTNVDASASGDLVMGGGTFQYDGVTYTVTTIKMPNATSSTFYTYNDVTSVTIAPTVTRIERFSGRQFPGVTELTIPGTVEYFCGTFQNASNLKKVTFEEGVKTITDDGAVMLSKSGVEEIYFPNSVETFDCTLSSAASLKEVTLPPCVTEIGFQMFRDCTALETVEALGEITAVQGTAFYGCTSLKTIPDMSNVTSMGTNAFRGCASLTGPIDLSSLTVIPRNAFYQCGVTGVKFSDQLTTIEKAAFQEAKLESLTLPSSLKTIGDSAFYNNNSLDGTVVIPEGVTTIGNAAFSYCYALDEVQVPSTVTSIGEEAFKTWDGRKTKIVIDNSEDSGIAGANAFEGLDPDQVVWEVPSIKDAGNTIASGKTLQEAVDEIQASGKPGVIVLGKDVQLVETLIIPKGADVTIEDEDQFVILANKDEEKFADLIKVEEGAKLTLKGSLSLNGRYNSGSIIDSEGAVVLAEDIVVKGSQINSERTGMIQIHGDNASLAIQDNAVVSDCEVIGQVSAPVLVTDGGRVEMTGGVIEDNKNTSSMDNQCGSAGILILEDGSGVMTGGVIRNNTGVRGAALNLFSYKAGETATFTLSGDALITENETITNQDEQESGAVNVEGYASLTMNGGTISNNEGGVGAGVAVIDYSIPFPKNVSAPMHTTFTMNGGTITGNDARNSGGGIYSLSNDVYLLAGEITNNTAFNHGGGVYSEGNNQFYSTINLQNAIVEENSAEQGGGLWLCPSGSIKVEDGGMIGIFDNEAVPYESEAGADVVSGKFGTVNHVARLSNTLQNYLPGGGTVEWYEDGAVYIINAAVDSPVNAIPSVFDEVPRYGEDGADPNPVIVKNDRGNLALKAVASRNDKALARSAATLKITGNSALHGGGIGANGGVRVAGQTVKIELEKFWHGDSTIEWERPDSVDVDVYRSGELYKTVTLTKADKWKLTLNDMIPGRYTFVEAVPNGYRAEYEITGESDSDGDVLSVKIDNTYAQPLPKTGDNSDVMLWGAVLCIACVGLAAAATRRRRS